MSVNDMILTMGTAYRGAVEAIRETIPRKDKQSTLALSILVYVDKNSGISQGELGKILRRDPMTMSQAVRSLQNASLITSQPDNTDRRIKRLQLTKKGKGLSDLLNSAESKLLGGLSKEWGKGRLNQFTKDLIEFNDYLNRNRI
ncbi:MAG: MarR family transcriptional regulator [Spirochaetales bacterium]|nr:MarR family transcriptional regulator [Spirochaetales bacterium]